MRALSLSTARAIVSLLAAAALLGGCTTVAKNPWDEPGAGPSPSELAVDACNPIGHLKCIYLTGRETLADGAELKFTFHWWRMSYIGRACEQQYGRTAGIIVEALSAIPHYSAMAIGNAAATLAHPFRRRDNSDDENPEFSSPLIPVWKYTQQPLEATYYDPLVYLSVQSPAPDDSDSGER